MFPALCCAGLLGAPSSRWFGVCVRAVCPGAVGSKGANELDAAALCAWGNPWPVGVRTGRSGWAAKEDTSVRRSHWHWLLRPQKSPFWSSASLLGFGLCVLQGRPRVPLRISSGSPLAARCGWASGSSWWGQASGLLLCSYFLGATSRVLGPVLMGLLCG